MKGIKRFNVKGKLAPESLSGVHGVFHVSQLKKCLHVLEEQIPLEELNVKEDLTYKEYVVKILETAERVTQSKVIKMCKVQWNRYLEDEATWEREEDLKVEYSQLFEATPLGVKHAFISQIMSIFISYMFIIACNLS
jgi:hypothetical protein